MQYHKLRLCTVFKPPRARMLAEEKWVESFTPIGRNPLEYVVTYRTWASPDECDFNLHLSNSSYAKTLDPARYKAAFTWFPIHFHSGGWMALASTQYHFLKEIPIFSKYEVRMSIGSWDEKWVYLLCKFVRTGEGHKSQSFSGEKQVSQGSLHTPETPLSTNTPPTELSPGNMTDENMKILADGITATEQDDDDWTLHAVSISLGCFKIGRITVPPAVMLPYNGLSSSPSNSTNNDYSSTNPPPHWHSVQSLLAKSHGGSIKKMQEFMKGGWRDVPENERWWETALAGNVEEKRLANLEAFKAIKNDYHVAKNL